MRRLIVLVKNILNLPYRMIFTNVSIFSLIQESEVDKKASISSMVKFYRSSIGRYSYVNRSSFVIDTKIGKFCSIGFNCLIGGASHPIDWVSTSPVFHKWDNVLKKNFSRHEYEIFSNTTIGNDVWIGANCILKSGITVGNGSIIGTGSVVTKNIGDYEIWAGNPAKKIRMRFDDEVVKKMKEVNWWSWSDDDIKKYSEYMTDVDEFVKRINI